METILDIRMLRWLSLHLSNIHSEARRSSEGAWTNGHKDTLDAELGACLGGDKVGRASPM